MLYQYSSENAGDEPPRTTNFMGEYVFELDGEPVDVKKPAVLQKIQNNRCFVKVDDKKKTGK